MGRYEVMLAHERQVIEADGFSQANDYVSFYERRDGVRTAIALVRMGPGDSIVEHVTKSVDPRPVGSDPKDPCIVYYGPHACDVCGAEIVKMGREYGGDAFDWPGAGRTYPNTKWQPHSCGSTLK